jgi:hypothetical protein
MERYFDRGREILKWIAIITMTVDHIGAVLYPEQRIFRFVGRLSFPLFSYLLVLGLETTRNVKAYFVRLFIFAFVSQIPFSLALGVEPLGYLNIFFTLSLGLLFVKLYEEKKTLLMLLPLLASVALNVDYGIYGILTIGGMYLLRRNSELGSISLLLLNLLFFPVSSVQLLSLSALPLILSHNNGFLKLAAKANGSAKYPSWRKYFFYVYYPLHLSILYSLTVVF